VTNASVKEKAIAWKVVLENDLLSEVEIADDFPLRDETALILLSFREQFRITVGAEAMRVEPHTASYKSTVSDISLYGPRSYNKANTEFIRTRLADFEARGLIKKAGPEITQASPVLIVRNAKKGPRFVVDLRSLSPLLEMQCRASIAVKDQMRFTKQGRWQLSTDLVEAYSQIALRESDLHVFNSVRDICPNENDYG
jgi:hypothetical protein